MTDQVKLALVTGAAGFVGRWLCEELRSHGVRVRSLDKVAGPGPWEIVHEIDLTQDVDLDPALTGVDTVFHLAGLAHSSLSGARAKAAYHELNVMSTRRLVDAAVRSGVSRFVLMSSVKVLGEGDRGVLGDDGQPLPTSEYGLSKLQAEQIVLDAATRSGLHAAVVRSALVYGPNVKGNLGEMIQAVVARRFPPLAETGNCRSLVDVRDVAKALWSVASSPAANGRAYVVTDGQDYSTRRILTAIYNGLGRRPPRFSLPPEMLKTLAILGDVFFKVTGRMAPYSSERHARLFGSAAYRGAAIGQELGFRPRFTLEDAAAGMVAEYSMLGRDARHGPMDRG